jgi:hypothetical protein
MPLKIQVLAWDRHKNVAVLISIMGSGSHYQEEEDWDPIIKRRKTGIPLSREGRLGSHYQEEEGWDPIIKRRKVGIPLSRGSLLIMGSHPSSS